MHRLQRLQDGDYRNLWEETKAESAATEARRKSKHHHASEADLKVTVDSQRRAAVLRTLANRGCSKAAKEIASAGIHELKAEVLQKLKDLHPQADLPVAAATADANSWEEFNLIPLL